MVLADAIIVDNESLDAFADVENNSSSLIKPIMKLMSCGVTIIADDDCFCVENGVKNVFNI